MKFFEVFRFWFSDEAIERVALEKTKRLAKRLLNETESTTMITLQDDEKDDEKWDCETVLTTYSNAYNHPKLITQIPTNKIRLSKKTGLPLTDKKMKKEIPLKEESSSEEDDDDQQEQSSITFERKKGETSEERRARKHAIKEMRRVNLLPSLSIPFVNFVCFRIDELSKKQRKSLLNKKNKNNYTIKLYIQLKHIFKVFVLHKLFSCRIKKTLTSDCSVYRSFFFLLRFLDVEIFD